VPVVAALVVAGLAPAGASVTGPPHKSMITVAAGLYTPFERTTITNAAGTTTRSVVPVEGFRLDIEPVTNGDFLDFVTAHPKWRKSEVQPIFADARYLARWPSDLDLPDAAARDEPVTNVSWFAAVAYCKADGLRLPTTQQWEYALADAGRGAAVVRARSMAWFAEPNRARPGAVGSSAPNSYGLRDMVGLVWEWTLDFDAYATTAESRDPNGKDSAQFCGGAAAGVSDPTDYPAFMRYAMRASLKADYTSDNLGFRCAGALP
jgi:formylglycine-generating enzyme